MSADIIYVGDIVTVDDARPTAEAVGVTGGRIVAVGARDAVFAEERDCSFCRFMTWVPRGLSGILEASESLSSVQYRRDLRLKFPPRPDSSGSESYGIVAVGFEIRWRQCSHQSRVMTWAVQSIASGVGPSGGGNAT